MRVTANQTRPSAPAPITRRALSLLTLGALGAPQARAAAGERPVVVASVGDVSSLDPHLLDINHPTGSVIWSLFDSLVRRAPDGTAVPRLAQSWETASPTVWRFRLRRDARFHDGSPLTAADVAFSFDRMNTPPFSAVQQLHEQTTLTGTRAVDDWTVELTTARPCATMLYWLAEAFVASRAFCQAHDARFVNQHPMGSGPYRFVEWVPGDHVTLAANPAYFGGAPAFKTVEFRVVPELSARLNGLVTGEVDLALELSPDTVGQADSEVSRAVSLIGLRKLHFGVSQTSSNAALRDARVRRAMNHAVDVPTLVRTVMNGTTVPLASVVNPPNADPALAPYAYDPALARRLLAEAGHPKGFDLTVSFTPVYGEDKEVAEATASYLSAVGIRPRIEALEWNDFREKLGRSSFEGIFYAGWAALIEPAVELVIFTCGQEDNASGYCDPDYDADVKRIAGEFDGARRRAMVERAQGQVWRDAYWIFLWRAPILAGMSRRIDYALRADDYVELYLAKPAAA